MKYQTKLQNWIMAQAHNKVVHKIQIITEDLKRGLRKYMNLN